MKKKKPSKNLIGQKFGRLTVIDLVESDAGANIPTKWICQCDCGKETVVRGSNLQSGVTRSCGCLSKELLIERHFKHGGTGSRLYVTWQHMIRRCEKNTDRAYKYYGGRGISVHIDWHDYTAFRDWALANGYADDLTIDRIDVNGNYEPSNCRWISLKEQQKNKRNNVWVVFNNETKNICDWARELNCRPQSVYRVILEKEGRIKNGFE